MRIYLLLVLSSLVFWASIYIDAQAVEVQEGEGDLFHITGCEKGELLAPVINLWSVPGGIVAGATVIGRLSGEGRTDQGLRCQGSIVRALEVKNIEGRLYIKIETVVGLKTGWITESFVGRSFKRSQCKSFFSEPKYQSNCLKK